jgi:uncharacterized protein involved in outer membrane biogenesis
VGIAAVLFIATIVAAYLILSTYDYNKFKPFIAKVVEDATGRKLTLAGDIDLEVDLSPTLVVEDVSFQNARDPDCALTTHSKENCSQKNHPCVP